MSKNLLEAAERITKELTPQERLQLAKELTQQGRRERWDRLFAMIDARVKRYGPPPTEEEIVKLCREVRRERAARRRP